MGIVVVFPLYCGAHKARDERRRGRMLRMLRRTSDAVSHNFSSLMLDKSSACRSANATTLFLIVAWQEMSGIRRWGTKAALRLHLHGRLSSTLVRWVTAPACWGWLYATALARAPNNSHREFSIDWHRAVCWLRGCQSSPPPSQHYRLRYYPKCLFISR